MANPLAMEGEALRRRSCSGPPRRISPADMARSPPARLPLQSAKGSQSSPFHSPSRPGSSIPATACSLITYLRARLRRASWDSEHSPWSGARMRSWARPRRRPGRSSRSRGNRRCCCGRWSDSRCSRRRRRRSSCRRCCGGRRRRGSLSAREYPNVINIFFVLVSVRIEVERG